MPQYIIAGSAHETAIDQILTQTTYPQQTSEANPFRNSVTPIIEARLGNAWFMAGNPMLIDTIEYAFLEGEGELFTEQRTGFDVDGMQLKARMVFAAAPIDFRNLYMNPGA